MITALGARNMPALDDAGRRLLFTEAFHIANHSSSTRCNITSPNTCPLNRDKGAATIGTVTAYHERSGWGWLRAEDGARHFRFSPISGHSLLGRGLPSSATSRHRPVYAIT